MINIKRRLQWLMFFRVVIASFFLGIAAITQLQTSDSYLAPYLVYIYCMGISIYLLTFVYIGVMPLVAKHTVFAFVQIVIDVFLISLLLYITGGINSAFPFMYSIAIISASIFLYLPGGIIIATISSCLYSLIIGLQHYGLISPLQIYPFIAAGYTDAPVYYPVVINVASFYLVALLSSFLAEQTKKSSLQVQQQKTDIENLEALNEHIIQSINSGLVTFDLERNIVTFNQAASEITGLSFEQVYQKHVEEVFPSIRVPDISHYVGSKKNISAPRFEASHILDDGTVLTMGFSISPLRDNSDREIGGILVFQDLTGFRAMEEQVKRMDRLAAVGRLAAGIAHEIRNPLASISGSIQVLKKNLILTDSDTRLMDIIIRESDNLSTLISNFTQYARPAEHKKETFNVSELIDEVLAVFRNSPEKKHVEDLQHKSRRDLCLTANKQQFRQILWNLVLNAAQAMQDTPGTLSIAASSSPEPAPDSPQGEGGAGETSSSEETTSITISVSDTGCGMGSQETERMFEPFYTTKENGSGLGLSIVHRIIQDHNGTVSVTSRKGAGTTVTMCIPLP